MRSSLKKYAPTFAIRAARAAEGWLAMRREFALDRARFARFAAPSDASVTTRKLSPRNLEAQLTKDYHRVEKGLALRAPKQPFGEQVLKRLDALLPGVGTHDEIAPYVEHARTARTALQAWNTRQEIDDAISPVRVNTKDGSDLAGFFASRHSVRDFEERQVQDSEIRQAVDSALNSPSVCNRQAWHVTVFRKQADVQRVLSFQNGNRGFGHVPAVAVVTVDAQLFAGVEERNQGWIEGGIFAMSFVWALHSLGIDSCMLNMSVRNKRAEKLRQAAGLADNEMVIMMIALGYGRDGHRIARSPHRSMAEVLTLN